MLLRFYRARGGVLAERRWWRIGIRLVSEWTHVNLQAGGRIVDLTRRGGLRIIDAGDFLHDRVLAGEQWRTVSAPALDPWRLLQAWPTADSERRISALQCTAWYVARRCGVNWREPVCCVTLCRSLLGLPVHAQAPDEFLHDLLTLHGGRMLAE